MTIEQKSKIDAALDRVISHYNAFRQHHHASCVTLNEFVYPHEGAAK